MNIPKRAIGAIQLSLLFASGFVVSLYTILTVWYQHHPEMSVFLSRH